MQGFLTAELHGLVLFFLLISSRSKDQQEFSSWCILCLSLGVLQEIDVHRL